MLVNSSVRCGVLAVVAVGAIGCGTGGGTLSGTGGEGTIPTGSGGAAGSIMTGAAGSIVTGDSCVDTRMLAAKLVPDVMIVLDTAATMNNPIGDPCISCGTTSKWQMAVEGINAAIAATGTQINWGLSFVASAVDACDAGGITVPLDETWQIKVELANRKTPLGNRPTRAAINVVTAYLSGRSWAHLPAIVLITDGVPGCKPGGPDATSDDTIGVVRAVGDALNAFIPTHVVGLGTAGGSADLALSEIAMAGGVARAANPSYDPASSAAEVLAALNVVAATADCAFVVPPPPTNDGSSSREYITVLNDGGAIFQDPQNGWTYTDNTHTGIRLNGSSCDAAHAGQATYISFICHPGLASP